VPGRPGSEFFGGQLIVGARGVTTSYASPTVTTEEGSCSAISSCRSARLGLFEWWQFSISSDDSLAESPGRIDASSRMPHCKAFSYRTLFLSRQPLLVDSVFSDVYPGSRDRSPSVARRGALTDTGRARRITCASTSTSSMPTRGSRGDDATNQVFRLRPIRSVERCGSPPRRRRVWSRTKICSRRKPAGLT
jgi:hypothetical protein